MARADEDHDLVCANHGDCGAEDIVSQLRQEIEAMKAAMRQAQRDSCGCLGGVFAEWV